MFCPSTVPILQVVALFQSVIKMVNCRKRVTASV